MFTLSDFRRTFNFARSHFNTDRLGINASQSQMDYFELLRLLDENMVGSNVRDVDLERKRYLHLSLHLLSNL